MRTIEIIGYKRANLGKSDARRLRAEGNVPCVMYGGEEQIHFYAPMILFRELVYTPDAAFVNLNIEGDEYKAILQDIQFHPVNELIMHADFLELHEGRLIKMRIPIRFTGIAPGIQQGGKLMIKLREVLIQALPQDMPEHIELDISELGLGDSVKIKDIETKNFTVLNSSRVTMATISIPRLMKGSQEEIEKEEAEAAALAAEAEEQEEESEE